MPVPYEAPVYVGHDYEYPEYDGHDYEYPDEYELEESYGPNGTYDQAITAQP